MEPRSRRGFIIIKNDANRVVSQMYDGAFRNSKGYLKNSDKPMEKTSGPDG